MRTPRMHMFTDGCAKQYKGRRNFRFSSNSVRELGFVVEHHFVATSHFKKVATTASAAWQRMP